MRKATRWQIKSGQPTRRFRIKRREFRTPDSCVQVDELQTEPVKQPLITDSRESGRPERNGEIMKASSIWTIVAGLILVAGSAFAANKGPLNLTTPMTVGGTQLAAGEYTVKWEGSGPDVELRIVRDGKVVTTVPAKVVTLEAASGWNAAVVNNNDDGTRNLRQIRFEGKKWGFQLAEPSTEASGADIK